MRESEPNSGLIPQVCGSDSSVAESLLEELRSAEMGLRGGMIRQKPGWRGRVYDFIWLIYSVFFLIQPIQEHSRKSWIVFAVAFSIFLGVYIAMVFSTSRRMQLVLLGAMAALGLAYYPYNAGACGMFIYVAAFVPFVTESIAFSVGTFIFVSASMMLEGWWLHLSPWSWVFCVFIAIAVGAGNLVAAQRMRANKRLNLAQEQIAHLAKVAERERIARDLHDVLGHTLSVVVLKSELAGKMIDRDPGRARSEIADVEQIARKALGEVREAIRGYRSEGLAAEIDRARTILDAAGVTLECEARPPLFAPAEETVISLIVREAVTNIVRHAQASRCRLDFQSNGHGTALVVEDDGRGGIRTEGNGLRGMRERVESIGGHLRIDSEQGTRLLIEIPPRAVHSS
ncbi:MAG: sensor histidine kinase [Acidobacteriaceae bacterium]